MRSSVRFPLHLPLAVRAESREQYTETSDISSNGVLFQADFGVQVGSTIEFTINMPAEIVGAAKDVVVNCVGRVVRCSPHGDRCDVAAVIDEYKFIR
jgi:PilZ domain